MAPYPPQFPRDMTWDRTRAAAVGSRRLPMAGFSMDGVDTSGSDTKVLVGRLVGSPVTGFSQAEHSGHVRQSGQTFSSSSQICKVS
jgi:hypothetical protein